MIFVIFAVMIMSLISFVNWIAPLVGEAEVVQLPRVSREVEGVEVRALPVSAQHEIGYLIRIQRN